MGSDTYCRYYLLSKVSVALRLDDYLYGFNHQTVCDEA